MGGISGGCLLIGRISDKGGRMALTTKWQDDFFGPELNAHWIGGHLNDSVEVSFGIQQGLRWRFSEGKAYASAGVVTSEPLNGDFEAELRFEVANPAPGTTLELAAIQVSPPPKTELPTLLFSPAHRVFDVHGAPPYVSSEFDEDDGWRIGWNLGSRQGGWNQQGSWQADNTDNRYGNDVNGPHAGLTTGWLRLSRQDGTNWTASGRRVDDGPWFSTGRKQTEQMNGPVHLRIAAKHWVKHAEQLTVAPANSIVITHFTLRT